MDKVDLAEKLALLDRPWEPRVIGELNGQYVKLARFEGEYVWHDHAQEDELFLVVRGRVRIELRDRTVELGEGQLFVVPRGVEHRPSADEPAYVLLFEPKSTVSTGSVEHELTVAPEDLKPL